jgi:dTDP-glucose 4,6-dehydratase
MRILITGGAGFIGSNFVRYMLEKKPHDELTVLDKLTYAGNLNNLKNVMKKIKFIKGDIRDKKVVESAVKNCDVILNFAAETHVDRSIIGAGTFIKTDILGTHRLLEAAKKNKVKKFIQISTDEVYGSREEGSFKEDDRLNPSNPYSASKGGADLLVHSYFVTYDLPIIITRSTNNFGSYQYPEKLIPKFIINAILNKPLPLYGDGSNIRDWLYVWDNCSAIELILQKGDVGEIYNVSGENEKTNLWITKTILNELKKPKDLIEFVEDRPGHDKRYSIDCTKIKKFGWKPEHRFEDALKKTIHWYKDNEWWWRPIIKSRIDFHPFFNKRG